MINPLLTVPKRENLIWSTSHRLMNVYTGASWRLHGRSNTAPQTRFLDELRLFAHCASETRADVQHPANRGGQY